MSNRNIDVDEQWKLLIGGEWVRTDETYDIIDPNSTELVGRAPEATVGHAQAAARAAKEALPGWKETPMAERCKLLAVAAERLAEVAPNWVDLVQAETGSTINVAETMQMSG
ncbi:MAG: aldehyde dehydrogenase family protein, partial [Acidimicrobiales bacterium]|nr:aldehyde dehydrogenase family protein [Acidimicrobiales bacterium]